MAFIPKPGRDDYSTAKSFRPISLTYLILKTSGRLCERDIKENYLQEKPLHRNQHAYVPGKSTDCIYAVVSKIETTLAPRQSCLGAIIDIERAFDKTTFDSINKALNRHGVDPIITGWISTMLGRRCRAIQITLSETTRGIVARGCPQGDVLSPLL